MRGGWKLAVAAIGLAAFTSPVRAEIDLSRASVERLPNGLTLIMLEDHSFPLVSTQIIYKSGARDETAGKTGLAHFLEHLAFRASAAFPNAAATEAIYDAGGEWHGYTWIDQTSYYSTMPRDGLELLLRIEADRMANVTIDPAAIAPEIDTVVTEMHSYENDPETILLDALTATAILVHPYRNNTIGFESDVRSLTLEDARAFYDRHYAPGNGVLAIVGDFDPSAARAMVARTLGALPPRHIPERTRAIEPPQQGERRTIVAGSVGSPRFAIAFPAPAASSPDLPAFLVLQQLLGGGEGVNFRQDDWGTPAVEGSVLHGMSEDVATWFIPTADRYLFVVRGGVDTPRDMAAIEAELGRRIARVPDAARTRLAEAKAAVRQHLVEDVESTENAAHQLAFFEGIGAFDMLIALPSKVDAVTAADVQRVARLYLTPAQRTVAWMVPGKRNSAGMLGAGKARPAAPRAGAPPVTGPAPAPALQRLAAGLPIIIQHNPLSPTVAVQLLLSAPPAGADRSRELAGLGTVSVAGAADELPALLDSAKAAIGKPLGSDAPASRDPAERMQQLIYNVMNVSRRDPQPLLLVVSGSVEPASVALQAQKRFGSLHPGVMPIAVPPTAVRNEIRETINLPLSQGSLGYAVRTGPPGTREGLAAQLLLYILTHDYSGRLGRSAIADKGLAYHIYSTLRTDGANAWATIWTGIDPAKADALEAELRRQLDALVTNPPTAAEIEAAKRRLLGRDVSTAQSNDELAAELAREFVETGGIRTHEALRQALAQVRAADIAEAARQFRAGTLIRVDIAAPRLSAQGGAKGRQ